MLLNINNAQDSSKQTKGCAAHPVTWAKAEKLLQMEGGLYPLCGGQCDGLEARLGRPCCSRAGKGDEGLNWDGIEGTKSVTWKIWN